MTIPQIFILSHKKAFEFSKETIRLWDPYDDLHDA